MFPGKERLQVGQSATAAVAGMQLRDAGDGAFDARTAYVVQEKSIRERSSRKDEMNVHVLKVVTRDRQEGTTRSHA